MDTINIDTTTMLLSVSYNLRMTWHDNRLTYNNLKQLTRLNTSEDKKKQDDKAEWRRCEQGRECLLPELSGGDTDERVEGSGGLLYKGVWWWGRGDGSGSWRCDVDRKQVTGWEHR